MHQNFHFMFKKKNFLFKIHKIISYRNLRDFNFQGKNHVSVHTICIFFASFSIFIDSES